MTTALQNAPDRSQLQRTSVLTVGAWSSAEFTAAIDALKDLRTAPHVACVDDACDLLATAETAPELILLAQPMPGSVRQQDIDRLQRLAPLARVVIVADSWCEGELRTGRPPTGALRLYWYELAPWWEAAQRRLAAGLAPAWSAPLDHLQAGRFIVDSVAKDLSTPRIVAIHAEDFAVYECLADALLASGATAVWTRGEAVPAAQAGIYDGGQLPICELEQLAQFCQTVSGRVISLLDFPRVEHISQAKAIGAAAVFAKPYIVEEVIAALGA